MVCGDDDGQTPFNELDKLFQKIEEGLDLVEAKYAVREKRSLFRKLGTVLNESIRRHMAYCEATWTRIDNILGHKTFCCRSNDQLS